MSQEKSMTLINCLCLNVHRGVYSSSRECRNVAFGRKLVIDIEKNQQQQRTVAKAEKMTSSRNHKKKDYVIIICIYTVTTILCTHRVGIF